MPDFLFEIGLEEIPARMIAAAQAELARRVEDLITRERLLSAGHEIYSYSTPRRLAVLVKGVNATQADTQEQLTGPSWNIAFKNGDPTPAAHAFAKKAGVQVFALEKITTPKGEYVSTVVERKGRTASEIIAEQLPKELAVLYWPKNMYWRAGKPERFVRPVKWLLALLNHAIVPIEFAGVHAANLTYGHRILYGDAALIVEHATDYLGVLDAAHVTADVELRRHRIRKGLDAATRKIPEARWREDEPLVDTVTHLTEWPSVLLGSFDPQYLNLPEEVLVTVMRDHQKYFAVEDRQSKLAPYFLTVLNTQPSEQADEIICHGNQRVLRARFNDARFFWTVDQKIPLTERVEMLKSVTFQKDLGSYYEKTERVTKVVRELGASAHSHELSIDALELAAKLAKTDLTSELVKEFTELQGIVGGLYAKAQGLDDRVALAIYDQYRPESSEDSIPCTIEGQLLAIADKADTIAGMFGIGLEPSGSKDPFALRRAANGIVKILAETALPFHPATIFAYAVREYEPMASLPGFQRFGAPFENVEQPISEFILERIRFYLQDVRQFRYDIVNAVLRQTTSSIKTGAYIPDAISRAAALTAVLGSEGIAAISAAFKRIKNILDKAREKSDLPSQSVKTELLTDPAERTLYDYAARLTPTVENLRAEHKYREALEQIATLRPHVDLFFDKVMVMADDPAIRQNRLALIAMVLGNFCSIADFSEIVTS
jgi:glycyl-tRNA synthetase beta chain